MRPLLPDLPMNDSLLLRFTMRQPPHDSGAGKDDSRREDLCARSGVARGVLNGKGHDHAH
jgi:hypothetical protein